jgi:hypothetical protein
MKNKTLNTTKVKRSSQEQLAAALAAFEGVSAAPQSKRFAPELLALMISAAANAGAAHGKSPLTACLVIWGLFLTFLVYTWFTKNADKKDTT